MSKKYTLSSRLGAARKICFYLWEGTLSAKASLFPKQSTGLFWKFTLAKGRIMPSATKGAALGTCKPLKRLERNFNWLRLAVKLFKLIIFSA